MKMWATLKLNNAGRWEGHFVKQRSNPLTVISLLDAPDHENVRRRTLARGHAIATSTDLELF